MTNSEPYKRGYEMRRRIGQILITYYVGRGRYLKFQWFEYNFVLDIKPGSLQVKRFLVIDTHQLILVEPDNAPGRLGE